MSASNTNKELQPASWNPKHTLVRQGRKLSLSSSLLLTIDLQPLVKGFAVEVRSLVRCEGIEYVNTERGILVRDGEICRHSCRYTLKVREEMAGQMLFTRGWRFNKDELAMLEALLIELLPPLRRALAHRGTLDARYNREDGDRVRSHPHRQGDPMTTAPKYEHSVVSPKTPRLSLVPLGEEGDYASELPESHSQDSASNPSHSGADSLFASEQGGSAFDRYGNPNRERHARLAESILCSGIGEQELFRRARKVLGCFAYSDEALVFMQRLASAARDID